MSANRYQLERYRKQLLNRVTSSYHITEYIENCLVSDDEAANHTFHKIMIHNWTGNGNELFDVITEYFGVTFIPVNYASQGDITSFFTCSLNLVLKMTKLDFMFPHQRNMYNIDILFNDRMSADCFENRVSIADIVSGVVSSRLNDKWELDLSNFSNDQEFIDKKISFYKVNLLANFKILMLRIGKDTKSLNLSNNNLSQVPIEILNFFIKGDLISVNLSNNNIPSLQELTRVSSKIEKLWVEGNPLCDEMDPATYVKQITIKFPRLTEIDGIKLNQHGAMVPFYRNYLDSSDKGTKMLIEKFLSLYFAHYDSSPRTSIRGFYDINAKLSITTDITAAEEKSLEPYANSRKAFNAKKRSYYVTCNDKIYKKQDAIVEVLSELPDTLHDPTTFNVDVLKHDKKVLILVVDGLYKERSHDLNAPVQYFQFRRTWIFHGSHKRHSYYEYYITNEMFSISNATKEMIDRSFKSNINTNPLALHAPNKLDSEALCNILSHITQLKRPEAELRLKINNWDIAKTLKEFMQDMKNNKVTRDRFLAEDDADDFTDTSSLVDDFD